MTTRTSLPKTVDLSGSLDGSTVTFTVPDTFMSGTLSVWINGLRLTPGSDFTEGANHRTFTLTGEDAPASGENMVVEYYLPTATRTVSGSTGGSTTPRQVADQFGTPRIMYD